MATYFQFSADDDYVKEHLSEDDIKKVKRWQSSKLDYEFSFHTQHEAGWPLYIIESGQRGQRNRPKINLKEPTYVILEGKNLNSPQVGKDAKDVVKDSLSALQELASAYYEGVEEEVEEPVQLTAKCVVWKCDSLACKGRQITEKIDENLSGQLTNNEAARVQHIKLLPKCKTCKKQNWKYVEVRNLGLTEAPDLKSPGDAKQI